MIQKYSVLLLIVTCFIISAGCSTPHNDVVAREGSVTGTVIDKVGTPVSGAIVSWSQDEKKWAKTSSDGSFLIEGINFGDTVFLIRKSGFRTSKFNAPIFSNTVTDVKKVIIETASFDYVDVKMEKISATHAIIGWKTNEFTNGKIEFGEGNSFTNVVREAENSYTTVHSLTLDGLKAQTRYSLRIISSRQNYQSETSETVIFETPAALDDSTPPDFPKSPGIALTEQPNQVTIFWTPNNETDLKGYRIYRSELPNSGFSLISGVLISKGIDRYVDTNVMTGKKYHYRVSAVDLAGNESSGSEIVSMVIPGDLIGEVSWTRANSPYSLAGDLDITAGGRLLIDPGVEIRMADFDALRRGDNTRVEIRVKGSIVASAGNYATIVFTTEKPVPASEDWGGISFSDASDELSIMNNVTIAYAKNALSIYKTNGKFTDIRIIKSSLGLSASQTQNLTISSFSVSMCGLGAEFRGNKNLTIEKSSFFHCTKGMSTFENFTLAIKECNFLEFTEQALYLSESTNECLVENNLFVSGLGLGIQIMAQSGRIIGNTFDAPFGIRIDKNNPQIEKNIIVSGLSISGQGLKGIEHLIGALPLPEFGPNNVFGFPSDKAYIGCKASAGSLASQPVFMYQSEGDKYDYRLKEAFPSAGNIWGINRQQAPSY
ncbi:MAG: right-handed parallel beta-helix repeat-containing protein [Candidatus Riflebacteria bacterium]|nr:right-handed parallel beta-helix repeat-containing protein [Candidatus Riflebacteria bacterium]